MIAGHLFCFGYGYSARRLTPHLIKEGWIVTATSRAGDGGSADGIGFFDFYAVDSAVLEDVTHVLVSIPPDTVGDPVLLRYFDIIKEAHHLNWIGYLSTTGVYGNTDGVIVDEYTMPNPTNKRSKYRLAAEQSWLGLNHLYGLPVNLFRLAGIYGPGRNALEQMRAGIAHRIELPGHKFSRIHVEDIAQVLMASIANPKPGEFYNVCDDEPASQSDVVAYASEILGLQPPPLLQFEDAKRDMTPMTQSFWRDNRIVDNSKIKTNLNVSLMYPTYREGLRAIFAGKID